MQYNAKILADHTVMLSKNGKVLRDLNNRIEEISVETQRSATDGFLRMLKIEKERNAHLRERVIIKATCMEAACVRPDDDEPDDIALQHILGMLGERGEAKVARLLADNFSQS